MARVDSFLKLCVVQGSSDLHLAVGSPPLLRYNGEINPIKFRDLGDAELDGYINEMLSESQRTRFAAGEDLDFSYYAQDVGRFRVNVYRTVNGSQAALRYVPNDIPAIRQLQLPPIVETFSDYKQGLVLVTGPTGS